MENARETPRQLAKKRRDKMYKSTIPCRKAGHVGLRYVSNRGCVACYKKDVRQLKINVPIGVSIERVQIAMCDIFRKYKEE